MIEIDQAPVLPRELTSLSVEVRAVGAAPMPQLAEPWRVRLADAQADAELLSDWMNRPHLVEAWEYPWPPERFERHMQAQLDGEYSRPFIIGFRGQDIGYTEIYRAAKDSIAPRYDAEPHDLGMHAAVAELRFLNRGLAPMLLPKVARSLFKLDPLCRRIMFDPDHRNVGARRLCEYVGCEFLGEHDMANRRMALYALHR